MRSESTRVRAHVSSEVAMPRMTSTNFITGTGFMRCIPMTLSGRLVAAPSFVMEIEEVFDASIASLRTKRSSARKTSRLTSRFSVTASMTKAASASSSSAVVVRMRSSIARFSSSFRRSLSTSRWRLRSIAATPRSRNAPSMSRINTS